jgi:hypothetical protein
MVTIFTYSVHIIPSTQALISWECSKASRLANCSGDIQNCVAISGEVSSGAMATISIQSHNGETGRWSNNILRTKERRVQNLPNSHSGTSPCSPHTPSACGGVVDSGTNMPVPPDANRAEKAHLETPDRSRQNTALNRTQHHSFP